MDKKRRKYSKHIFFLSAGILMLISIIVIIYSIGNTNKILLSYHGPNPNIQLIPSGTDDPGVLAKHTVRRRQYVATVEATSTPIIPTPDTSTPIATPTPSVIAAPTNKKIEQYGIAAGGGLIGLSQTALDQYFTNMKLLGATWVRWDIDWGTVQHDNSSTYDWSSIDRVANTAKKYGINNLGIIDAAPRWAADPGCTTSSHQCPPQDPAQFATFAGAVATRYKDIISYFEIWNEPNINWGNRPDVNNYANVLKDAYIKIKAVNPSAIVLTGGLAATGDDQQSGDLAPVSFVKGLYAAGVGKYFDVLALHPYSFPATPEYIAPWNSWQQMTEVHQVMIANGDTTTKIWVTEYGAPTGGSGSVRSFNQLTFNYGSDYMNEAAQVEYLNEIANYYDQNTSWLGGFMWYALQDLGTSTSTPENFFGLLKFDGSQKPGFSVYQQIIANSK